MFYKLLKPLVAVFIVTLCLINLAHADVVLTPQEKTVFSTGDNLGKVSYLIADILSNDKSMGVAILNEKLASLQNLLLTESKLDSQLSLNKKTKLLLEKLLNDTNSSYKNGKYNKDKLTLANKSFSLYSKELSNSIKNSYGPKNVWLYDVGWLAEFTNTSMQSDSANKLVLNNFNLLQNVPFDLSTSIVACLTTISTVKETQLNPAQVELMKEASQNIIKYFIDPENYVPPVTMKDLVGKWEGRMSAPDGKYYKTSLILNPDLTGYIESEKIFKEPIPVNSLTLTQTAIGFEIKPLNDDRLIIRFVGRIVDDMMSGEAIDLSGKKGLWQFLKTTPLANNLVKDDSIKNDDNYLNKIIGTWKGKILEESGGISNSTVYFSLVGDNIMVVENDNVYKKLKIKSVAVNSNGIKFNIEPKDDKLDVTFLGKFNGRIIEGNAKANDGTRAYWKLVKVSDEVPESNESSKLKINKNLYDSDGLCDPIISDNDTTIIFAANKKVVTNKKTVRKPVNKSKTPAITLKETTYKGYIIFDDATKAELTLNYNKTNPDIFIKGADEESNLPLKLDNLKVNDREISFKTTVNDKDDTTVIFKGRYFDNYIFGQAINSAGKELKWELVSLDSISSILPERVDVNKPNLTGIWIGKANFAELVYLPITLNSNNTSSTIKIGDTEPLYILKSELKDINFTLEASKDNNSVAIVTFNGIIDNDKIKGKINNPDGSTLNVILDLKKDNKSKGITGLWNGNVSSGSYNADIVFNFLSNKRRVFIDDSKAKAGRLELQVKDLFETDNSLKFKLVQGQTGTPIEVFLNKSETGYKGYMKNQIKDSKKLNLVLNSSDLVDYFSNNIKTSSLNVDKKANENIVLNNDKANNKDAKGTENKGNVEENPNNKVVSEENKNTVVKDSTKVEIKDNNANTKTPDVNIEKEKVETTKIKQNEDIAVVDAKSDKQKEIKQNNETKTLPEESKIVNIKVKDLLGKWTGELTDPQKEKGEILLEIKDVESYMYVDHSGEKVPFKLFDFNFDGKNISFKIKPSPDLENSIKFNGNLIEGVLSGEAIDPNGGKGKWYAKRI